MKDFTNVIRELATRGFRLRVKEDMLYMSRDDLREYLNSLDLFRLILGVVKQVKFTDDIEDDEILLKFDRDESITETIEHTHTLYINIKSPYVLNGVKRDIVERILDNVNKEIKLINSKLAVFDRRYMYDKPSLVNMYEIMEEYLK